MKKEMTRIINWGASKAIKIPYALLVDSAFPFQEKDYDMLSIEIVGNKIVIQQEKRK